MFVFFLCSFIFLIHQWLFVVLCSSFVKFCNVFTVQSCGKSMCCLEAFIEFQSIVIFFARKSRYYAIRLLVEWCKHFPSPTHPLQTTIMQNHLKVLGDGADTLRIQKYSDYWSCFKQNAKTLYIEVFLSAVCVCVVWVKIRLLADPHCVGDGNSLPEPWGSFAAGDGVCMCTWCCLCVCVHISAGKGRAGPTVHVSTAKSSTLLIQPSRDVFVFLTALVCVCLKNFVRSAAMKLFIFYSEEWQKAVQNIFSLMWFFLNTILNFFSFIRVMLILFESIA